MSRLSAILLLVQITLSLIAPALFAGSDVNLPACCRKDGKHHCAMSDSDAAVPGALIQGVKAKCPAFPKGEAAPVSSNAGVLIHLKAHVAAIISYPAAAAQAETLYRVSFSRSSQKRGPPSLLS